MASFDLDLPDVDGVDALAVPLVPVGGVATALAPDDATFGVTGGATFLEAAFLGAVLATEGAPVAFDVVDTTKLGEETVRVEEAVRVEEPTEFGAVIVEELVELETEGALEATGAGPTVTWSGRAAGWATMDT